MTEGTFGSGVDIAHIPRIRTILAGPAADGFVRKVFTDRELALVPESDARVTHVAARFAVKEAVFKALGTAWTEAESLHDIEVLPSRVGAPIVVLAGRFQRLVAERGAEGVAVSMSWDEDYAIAVATLR